MTVGRGSARAQASKAFSWRLVRQYDVRYPYYCAFFYDELKFHAGPESLGAEGNLRDNAGRLLCRRLKMLNQQGFKGLLLAMTEVDLKLVINYQRYAPRNYDGKLLVELVD